MSQPFKTPQLASYQTISLIEISYFSDLAAFLRENGDISQKCMISNEDLEARKWDMDLIRGAFESWDSILSSALEILTIYIDLGSLRPDISVVPDPVHTSFSRLEANKLQSLKTKANGMLHMSAQLLTSNLFFHTKQQFLVVTS